MALSSDFERYALEQLGAAGEVSARRMFGGVGLYRDGLFFGLLHDNAVYLKVDEQTRPRFEAAGMRRFSPYADGRAQFDFFELPGDALEDPERLADWLSEALAVARRAKSPRRRRR
jgi:DNA transformation protein